MVNRYHRPSRASICGCRNRAGRDRRRRQGAGARWSPISRRPRRLPARRADRGGLARTVDLVPDTEDRNRAAAFWSTIQLRTSVDGVFAAGDCAEIRTEPRDDRNVLQQVWYTGKMQGEVVGERARRRRARLRSAASGSTRPSSSTSSTTYGRVNTPAVFPRDVRETSTGSTPSDRRSDSASCSRRTAASSA